MIDVVNIEKSFKIDFWKSPLKALDNLSFHVPEGQITGYLGANGAGKTTSLKIMMNFIRADKGQVKFKNNKNLIEFRNNIGFLPERPYFYPHLTGLEFLTYMGELSVLNKPSIRSNINRWSPRFSIEHALERKIHSYSKGMLQRLGFVAMLLHDPELLILDEPISGLDPIGRKELKDAIREIHKEGKTIFFSTHIVSDVQEICKKVVFIENGKLIYQGPIDKILSENRQAEVSIKVTGAHPPSLFHKVIDKDIYILTAQEKNRDELIKNLISSGYSLLEVTSSQPTLEEIFYKVRAAKSS